RRIWRQAYNQTVFHVAIMQEAEESGISVAESQVDRQIAQHPQFQEAGSFSPEAYRNASSQEKFALRQFLRESLIHEQLIDDKLNGMRTAPEEIAFVKAMASPERKFDVARFTFDDYPAEEVRAYGEENAQLFQEIDISRITIDSRRQEAERILEQIENRTAGFEELAQAHSVDRYAEDGGEVGSAYFYELEREFEDREPLESVFQASAGTVTEVLETRNAWVIFRVNEPAVPVDLESEEGLQVVRTYMESFERGRIEDYLITQAEEFRTTAAEDGFAAAADAAGVEPSETPFFPINYGNLPFFTRVSSQGGELENAAFREDLLMSAFSIDEGEITEPYVLRDSVVLLHLVEEREPAEDGVAYLDDYYDSLVQQFQASQLERSIIDQDKLEDNFTQTFSRYVLGQ
ncbi:MAG: peptidyl-prolyl cis-trans isomerase, partial [Spirochaetota bacterium]